MKPVSPIELDEVIAAERLETFCAPGVCQHEPKHDPLPVLLLNDGSGSIVTRWEFTARERVKVADGADLYLYLDTSNVVPPMLPTLFGPHTVPETEDEAKSGSTDLRARIAALLEQHAVCEKYMASDGMMEAGCYKFLTFCRFYEEVKAVMREVAE